MYVQNGNRLTDTENKLVIDYLREEESGKWEGTNLWYGINKLLHTH